MTLYEMFITITLGIIISVPLVFIGFIAYNFDNVVKTYKKWKRK